jgi:hypothetical protein
MEEHGTVHGTVSLQFFVDVAVVENRRLLDNCSVYQTLNSVIR